MTRAILCMFTAILVCAPGAARADSAADAKAHWERGVTAYGLGRFSVAAQEYEAAYELKPQPSLLYNAAQAHRLAGNKPKALILYKLYLSLYGAEIPNREEVQRRIAELSAAPENQPPPPVKVEPKPLRPAPSPTPPPTTTGRTDLTTPATTVTTRGAATRERRPVYKRGWFWATVAGAAVLVAGGVTLGVVLGSNHDRDPMPSIGSVPGN